MYCTRSKGKFGNFDEGVPSSRDSRRPAMAGVKRGKKAGRSFKEKVRACHPTPTPTPPLIG